MKLHILSVLVVTAFIALSNANPNIGAQESRRALQEDLTDALSTGETDSQLSSDTFLQQEGDDPTTEQQQAEEDDNDKLLNLLNQLVQQQEDDSVVMLQEDEDNEDNIPEINKAAMQHSRHRTRHCPHYRRGYWTRRYQATQKKLNSYLRAFQQTNKKYFIVKKQLQQCQYSALGVIKVVRTFVRAASRLGIRN